MRSRFGRQAQKVTGSRRGCTIETKLEMAWPAPMP